MCIQVICPFQNHIISFVLLCVQCRPSHMAVKCSTTMLQPKSKLCSIYVRVINLLMGEEFSNIFSPSVGFLFSC